jgi:1,2-diacylglycerol 3-beta-galactosyltransferase
MGHPQEKVSLTSGMILRPAFYEQVTVNLAAERTALGLRPDLPTGLMLFGGEGSVKMMEIAVRLQQARRDFQLILICGRNEKLAARLREMPSRFPMHVVGFTQEVPRYMRLADFFIGKPGPGSISEALAMRLPVVIERNAWTLPQERYNTDWVREKGVGIVVHDFAQIAGVVDSLLEPDTLASYRAKAGAIDNRAVFEIPDILARIMDSSR